MNCFAQLIADAMVLEHPGGGYVVSTHPDIDLAEQVEQIAHKDMLYSAWVVDGELTLVSSVLVDDAHTDLAVVWERLADRHPEGSGPGTEPGRDWCPVSDATVPDPGFPYGRARLRVWR